MQRYKTLSTSIKDISTKKSRYSSTFYPEIPFKDSDIYIYSRSSDRLDLLAHTYYGDQTFWWVIARVNNLGKGSFMIPPGIRLRIPFPMDELELRTILNNL
jgi:hypothetical protein